MTEIQNSTNFLSSILLHKFIFGISAFFRSLRDAGPTYKSNCCKQRHEKVIHQEQTIICWKGEIESQGLKGFKVYSSQIFIIALNFRGNI